MWQKFTTQSNSVVIFLVLYCSYFIPHSLTQMLHILLITIFVPQLYDPQVRWHNDPLCSHRQHLHYSRRRRLLRHNFLQQTVPILMAIRLRKSYEMLVCYYVILNHNRINIWIINIQNKQIISKSERFTVFVHTNVVSNWFEIIWNTRQSTPLPRTTLRSTIQ